MSLMVGGITAAQLDGIDIPPLSWTVPGLLPEGFGILAAAAKIGKSWLVLSLGLAVASGKTTGDAILDDKPRDRLTSTSKGTGLQRLLAGL